MSEQIFYFVACDSQGKIWFLWEAVKTVLGIFKTQQNADPQPSTKKVQTPKSLPTSAILSLSEKMVI